MNKSNLKLFGATAALLIAVGFSLKMALAITAFVPADQPIGYIGQDDMTNYNLTSGQEYVYRGNYEKLYWSGNLIAYQVNSAGDISTATQPWNGGAAYQIDQQGPNNRIIFTMKSDGSKIPFTWDSLSTGTGSQQADLVSADVVNYLRGDRTNEVQLKNGGSFRQRQSPMGDVIHSRPLYLSDSESGTPNPTVFVGANDGMLHAINAKTGAERWAYVPSMLIPKMAKLSVNPAPGASFPHDYYVDGSMVTGYVGTSKRVLVGALGGGGKGLYALDITGDKLAPADEATAKNNILWEITPTSINKVASTSYTNLGYTYSNPSFAKVGVNDAVIVGNGYNNGGDYQAYLYIIKADTGELLSAIKAGTSGTAASPNGLSTPVAIDADQDGTASIVYAGDLNGTMWKFDLRTSPATVTALLTTSPAQPITMTPGVSTHPNGGYMVDFATGAMLRPTDTSDTATFSAYGVWDGAPSGNTTLLQQTLTERCYRPTAIEPPNPCTSRVRTVTANAPDWTVHKGWKVNLPASEKVVGDGSYISNGRFYFTSHNPTVVNTVTVSASGTQPTVNGENWLMELNYLTGGSANAPFLDMNGSAGVDSNGKALPPVLDANDRVRLATSPFAIDTTTDGIPVGKFLSVGVMSQPVLVQLSTLNNTFYNQNPDSAPVSVALGTAAGVAGGHFDVDIFYAPGTNGARATATLTISTTGQQSPFPATLGSITVDGVEIVPAMSVDDIPNGGASTSTNAAAIATKLTNANNGFTVSRNRNVLTISAPIGSRFNGKAITVNSGSSQTLIPASPAVDPVIEVLPVSAVRPTGFITFTPATGGLTSNSGSNGGPRINNDLNGNSVQIGSGGNTNRVSNNTISLGTSKNAVQAAAAVVSRIGTGGTYKAYVGGTTGITPLCASAPTNSVCIVDTSTNNNGSNNGRAISLGSISGIGALSVSTTPTAGGVTGVNGVTGSPGSPAVAQSGWTNFATAVTASSFDNGGADAASIGDTCTGTDCKYDTHFHQYDDVYDVTGVNAIKPSSSTLNITKGIPSLTQDFKILVHNQYLSPAVKLNFGRSDYVYNQDFGYTPVKDYATSATVDLATLQTYRRDPAAVWTGGSNPTAADLATPKPISNLVFNMPLDALTPKNWWGNGDVRVGLIPMAPQCMWQAKGTTDGNMYQPTIPPANGTDGPGQAGWNSNTTPSTATGARHGGALMLQLVRADTPNSAVELNVANRPEYGWRVKSSEYSKWVLMEYGTYWHHPNQKCFYQTGWTKTPGSDDGSSTTVAKAAGSTDPVLGNLSAGTTGTGTITNIDTTVSGKVTTTTVTYVNGSTATIVSTVSNDNKTVTIVTTDAVGTVTTQTVLNSDGSLTSGGQESRTSGGKTGRVSWRELVAP